MTKGNISDLRSSRNIPNGTYPIAKSIDGAVAAFEDPTEIPIKQVGVESMLDFDSAWPLIWPQKTVLFQTDDEWYESTGNFSGFWNSELFFTSNVSKMSD